MGLFVNWHELEGTVVQPYPTGLVLGESRFTIALICHWPIGCCPCSQANETHYARPAPSWGISQGDTYARQ